MYYGLAPLTGGMIRIDFTFIFSLDDSMILNEEIAKRLDRIISYFVKKSKVSMIFSPYRAVN